MTSTGPGCVNVNNPERYGFNGTLSTQGADQYNIRSKSTSVYFLDSIEFNPQWILDLGVRRDKFETDQVMTYGALNSAVTAAKPTAKAGDKLKLNSDSDFFNYQAGFNI